MTELCLSKGGLFVLHEAGRDGDISFARPANVMFFGSMVARQVTAWVRRQRSTPRDGGGRERTVECIRILMEVIAEVCLLLPDGMKFVLLQRRRTQGVLR